MRRTVLEPPQQFDLFTSRFFQEIIKQGNFQDDERSNNNYQELFIQSFKPQKNQVDSLTKIQISAFYHSVAAIIEKEIGEQTEVFINLNSKGLSSALVCCGSLVVINKVIDNVRDFQFNSLEELAEEGERIIAGALNKASQYFDLPSVIYSAA